MKFKRIAAFVIVAVILIAAVPRVDVESSSIPTLPYMGIDVSSWQGEIDWSKVLKCGVDFAMLRCYANGKDKRFDEYYSGATIKGIYVGAYVYMYAKTAKEAENEAKAVISALGGKKLTFPLFLDVEDASLTSLGKKTLTDIMLIELKAFQKAGYRTGFYTYSNFLSSYIDESRLGGYDKWIARWTCSSTTGGYYHSSQNPYQTNPNAHMWQFSNNGNGKYFGVGSTSLDLDYCYYDYIFDGKNICPYESTDPDDYSVPTRDLSYASGNVKIGVDVAWVQAVLFRLGYNVEIDGSYGPATGNAVKQFQKDHGLSADGSVGSGTRSKLNSCWNDSKKFTALFSFDLNGGKGTTDSISVNNMSVLRIPAWKVARYGYSLGGWNVKRLSDNKWYTSGGWLTEDQVETSGAAYSLYTSGNDYVFNSSWYPSGTSSGTIIYEFRALWIPNDYTVTFDAAGGVCEEKTRTVTFMTTYGELPETQREGYVFEGWYLSPDGNSRVSPGSTLMAAMDITIYAHWSCIHEYELAQKTDPGCVDAGEKIFECTRCHDRYSEEIPPIGHVFERGYCTVCGAEDPDYTAPTLSGDANCDGAVNMKDALAVRRHAAFIIRLEGVAFANADMNYDGYVNLKDLLLLRKKILNIPLE
ncbi:MAG: InlB B-repeat-containing protein [Clostridia bacterium]|nr:InlB B-repeat-containing protein [Clostridia bacterium]